ncbi:hypothetical protein CV102_17300 [Natronococcus pandeyae]|uniref:Restriction endonuclease n=1 Tax=Natronococcus pandeyae TaxID=2055836 RepID=A0A8J8TR55_9EURY|nr:hypothetical protein [Natronococcus pandeyae]TYL37374.1 hypothetical protein CV102_17300 [Natronococcus pandeyae]
MSSAFGTDTISIEEDVDSELDIGLPPKDIEALEAAEDLSVSLDSDGRVTVNPGRKIGLVGLPSGRVLEVTPKVEFNLLYYLAYSGRIDESLAQGRDVGISAGDSFVDLVAQLFVSELDRVLRRGLYQEYRTEEDMEEYIRGRFDVTRQITTQGPVATRFACEYDELTYDLPINHVLVTALEKLRPLVSSPDLESDLWQGRERLRQYLDYEPAIRIDPSEIVLTRQTNYYERILTLCELILDETYIDNLGAGHREFQSILLSTADLFENIVFRAIERALGPGEFRVAGDGDPRGEAETNIGYLLTAASTDDRIQKLYPDVYVTPRSSDVTVLVGDAKWKDPDSNRPSSSDLYQLTAYQAKVDAPVLLIYPDLDGRLQQKYSYLRDTDETSFDVFEVNTTDAASYETFEEQLTDEIQSKVTEIVKGL